MNGMQTVRYFDNAATTMMSPEALKAYTFAATTYPGNPSSLHPLGLEAKKLLQQCREDLGSLLGVDASSLTFTSGATESNAIILNSLIWKMQKAEVIMSGIEHPSISEHQRLFRHLGWNVVLLGAKGGFVCPKELQQKLTKQTRLVTVMLVNNVTGSIQPIEEIVQTVRAFEAQTGRKIHIHTDATQALGKIPFSLTTLGVDSASFSAHKVHGPRGVGLLYNTDPSVENLSRAGEQESGVRGGTENLAGIYSMTNAMKEALEHQQEHFDAVNTLNTMLRSRLGFLPILSPDEHTSPYILNLSIPNLPSEVCSRMLFDQGFCISSGSACSNNAKQKGESVLSSMQISAALSKSSIRISFSKDTTKEDTEALAQAITTLYREHA